MQDPTNLKLGSAFLFAISFVGFSASMKQLYPRGRFDNVMIPDFKIRLPGSALDVPIQCFGDIRDQDVRRFAAAFQSVWQKIRPQDRDQIEGYWGSTDLHQPACIELHNPWLGESSVRALATNRGTELRFSWPICELLPDGMLEILIAHELAHVYQWSIGKHLFNLTFDDLNDRSRKEASWLPLPRRDDALAEIHADEIAAQWGYDCVLKDAYLLRNYEKTDAGYLKREEPLNEKRAYNEAQRRRRLTRFIVRA